MIPANERCIVNIAPSYVKNVGSGFYRGIIADSSDSDQIVVLLVDICKVIKTQSKNLRQILTKFEKEPTFVRICDFYGLKEKNVLPQDWNDFKK